MMHYYNYGYGFGFFDFLGIVIHFTLIAAVIYIIIRVLMHIGGGCRGGMCGHSRHAQHDSSHSALEILKERYARGEITKEEYEEKKKDIEK